MEQHQGIEEQRRWLVGNALARVEAEGQRVSAALRQRYHAYTRAELTLQQVGSPLMADADQIIAWARTSIIWGW